MLDILPNNPVFTSLYRVTEWNCSIWNCSSTTGKYSLPVRSKVRFFGITMNPCCMRLFSGGQSYVFISFSLSSYVRLCISSSNRPWTHNSRAELLCEHHHSPLVTDGVGLSHVWGACRIILPSSESYILGFSLSSKRYIIFFFA